MTIKTITKWTGAKTADGESAFDAEVNAALAAGWQVIECHTTAGTPYEGTDRSAEVEVYITAILGRSSDIVEAR